MPNDQTPSTRIAGTLRLGGLTPVSRPEKPVDEKKAAPPPDVDAKPKLENLYPVMKATWPHLFMPDAPVPLAEGVHFEMAKALVVSKHAVGRVLKGWVNRPE